MYEIYFLQCSAKTDILRNAFYLIRTACRLLQNTQMSLIIKVLINTMWLIIGSIYSLYGQPTTQIKELDVLSHYNSTLQCILQAL